MTILIAVAAIGLLLFLFRERWLLFLGDFLIVEDRLRAGDVIHVIAGEDYRTDYAIQLYKSGYGKKLFFTGGWCKKHQYDHGVHGQQISLAAGVPLDAIAFDDAAVTSTYMEAERLRGWILQSPYPVRSVIVVSDPLHMRRARWTYQRVLGDDIEVQMAPVPFELTPYERAWWRNREGRSYVWTEYQKYVYYILRYQLSRGRLQEWLISFDTE
jgi:uncharacterized SAM-binding protein YcdF (DUF218 family)